MITLDFQLVTGLRTAAAQDDTDVLHLLYKYGLDVLQAAGLDDCAPSVTPAG